MCWQLKIGLSAWGNAQAQSHYQTKLSSDVESVYFQGVKSAAFLLFVIGGWKAGWRRGDRGLEKDEFASHISHFSYFVGLRYTIISEHVS